MPPHADGLDLIRISQARTDIVADGFALAAAADGFRAQGYLKLSSLLVPALRDEIIDALDRAEFYEREHHGIGKELCVVPGAVTGVLEFLLNDPALLAAMSDITRVGPIGCFTGRVYRMSPSTGHYDSWHNDVGEDRLLACSLNLGREPFDGGQLQIRHAGTDAVLAEVANGTPGDAVVFKIDRAYQHRVSAVRGHVSRTAYAGWFRTRPDYRTLLAHVLNADGAAHAGTKVDRGPLRD